MLSREEINTWIQNGPDNSLVEKVKAFGEEIKRGDLTTSQIRQVFTKVKAIEAKGIERRSGELVMLKPLLAYAASRNAKAVGLQSLKEMLSLGIDEVINGAETHLAERYRNFCKLFEATLAYHRACGGK